MATPARPLVPPPAPPAGCGRVRHGRFVGGGLPRERLPRSDRFAAERGCRQRELRGRAMHLDAGADERVDEARRGRVVGLIGRDHVRARVPQRGVAEEALEARPIRRAGVRVLGPLAALGAVPRPAPVQRVGRLADGLPPMRIQRPRVGRARLDRVAAHAPDVEQQVPPIARGVVENRVVGRQRVIDRLAEVPVLGLDREWGVVGLEVALPNVGDAHRRRAADGLGEQPDHVVVVGRRAEPAVPPRRVPGGRAHHGAGLALREEAQVHSRAELVDAQQHHGVQVVVGGTAEGRRVHHRAAGPRLVVVVDDLRIPLAVHHPVHVPRFGQVGHVEVAVVVVPRVVLVQDREIARGPLLGVVAAHVPVGHQFVAIGIRMHEQDDDLVEDAQRLSVIPRNELIYSF
jgi:hypothetical protein